MTTKIRMLNKVGVDVSKKKLDIALDEHQFFTIENNEKAFDNFLKSLNIPLEEFHFVMEATGGYERKFTEFLLSKSLKVSVINPKRVRDYAKSLGILAKNDRIDAYVIRGYAQMAKEKLVLLEQKKPNDLKLIYLIKRRKQLTKHLKIEKQFRETATDKEVLASIKQFLEVLEKQIACVDKSIHKLMSLDDAHNQRLALISDVKGIGELTACTILISLPELGKLNNKQIAALTGTAPFCNDSGERKGRKTTWGGRKDTRTALYMPMLSAIQYNPQIKAFYDRLVAKGKIRKVAVIACMRKMLTILNAMLKNNTKWDLDYAKSH